VLRVKLPHLDGWTAARQRNADRYRRMFKDAGVAAPDGHAAALAGRPGVVLPWDAGYGRHIYNQFVIRVGRRDALMAHLKEQHIGCEVYYPVPLHLQECFQPLGYKAGDLPASEAAADETLGLPIYPELTEDQQRRIVCAVLDDVA
jgi:dTDP-4-amino-4,6-dideoxygalactose transaminase